MGNDMLLVSIRAQRVSQNMKKTFEGKRGHSNFKRFEEFVREVINVPKKELDKREAEYQRTKKAKKPA